MPTNSTPSNKNLYALLEQSFRKHPDKAAFISTSGPDGSALDTTYGALINGVDAMAGALKNLGVTPGDRVMVQVDKSLDNVRLYLATLKIGAIYNPLNTAYTAAELDYFMSDAEPALLVVDRHKLDAIRPIAEARNIPAVETLPADGSGSLSKMAATAAPLRETVRRGADDLAVLIYTSGTTGRSKGAMLTHMNLVSNAQVLHDYWGFAGDDVLLHALPIYHVHGLFVALHTAFLSGATILWLPKFDAEAIIDLLPKSTVIMGVPTFYTRLLAHSDFGKNHCRNIRLAISGSAPMLAETHVAFEARTGVKILERYGMSEAGMITSNPYHDGERIAGTVGYALPGTDLRVTGEDGAVLGADQTGVLEIKGPNVFKGYWRNPEKTAEDFRDDGYFITGDLAQMAADGRVTIVGRAKDLIISGGLNIYPKEIEDELNALPEIRESAVIGVSHGDFGEAVVAVVVPEAGSDIGEGGSIIGALEQRLAKFKLPKRVIAASELPRNAMGKVQKNSLRNQFAQIFS